MIAQSTAVVCRTVVLTDTKLSALSALVAIAIGLCVAYLALDKLRHRHGLALHVEKLSKEVDGIPLLLLRVDQLTMIEKIYLGLEYYCVNDDSYDALKVKRNEFCDGTLDSFLTFLLQVISEAQIDRWALKVCASLLFLIEFYITFIMLDGNSCGAFINTQAFAWATMFLSMASFLIPAVFSPLGSQMLKMCRQTVQRSIKDAKKHQQAQAQTAQIPGVDVTD